MCVPVLLLLLLCAGHDQGINVRQRAGALVVLLNDRDKLTEERQKVGQALTYTARR